MKEEHALLAAVIKQAVIDSHRQSKRHLRDKKDALEFLHTDRLNDFIKYWNFRLNAGVVRKMAKEGYEAESKTSYLIRA